MAEIGGEVDGREAEREQEDVQSRACGRRMQSAEQAKVANVSGKGKREPAKLVDTEKQGACDRSLSRQLLLHLRDSR
jgi:hypothetical protein